MRAYGAILFDMDDTLIDFKQSERKSLQRCYDLFFKNHVSLEAFQKNYSEINQPLWRLAEQGKIPSSIIGSERFKQLAALYGTSFDPETVRRYEDGLIQHTEWVDGAVDLLEKLQKNQIKIGFITNGFSTLQRSKFNKLNLARYSDTLVISEEFGVSKPHPAIFLHALDQLKVDASDTLMVGDSLTSDGQGAYGVKMSFCWYNPTFLPNTCHWQPDQIISHLEQLHH